MHSDLPNEQSIGLPWWTISGHTADQYILMYRRDRGGFEMAALQQIAVRRIWIERWTVTHQPVQRHPIGWLQSTKSDYEIVIR
jgi:hypothetical protein